MRSAKVTEQLAPLPVSAHPLSPAGAAHPPAGVGAPRREGGLDILRRRFPRLAQMDEASRLMWLALVSLYTLMLALAFAPLFVGVLALGPLLVSVGVIMHRDWQELAPYHTDRPPPSSDVSLYLEVLRDTRAHQLCQAHFRSLPENSQDLELDDTLVEPEGCTRS